jgi:hypothetical protein
VEEDDDDDQRRGDGRGGSDDLMIGSVRITTDELHFFPNESEFDVATVKMRGEEQRRVAGTDSDRHFLVHISEHKNHEDSNS